MDEQEMARLKWEQAERERETQRHVEEMNKLFIRRFRANIRRTVAQIVAARRARARGLWGRL